MFRTAVSLFLLLILVAPFSSAHALVPTGIDPLSFSLSPKYPRPYDPITVTLKSSLIDLYASTASISINGTEVDAGLGVRSVTGVVGAPGTPTRISATVESEGQTFTKELTIRPADVALIIEPVTTAHPFYQGALLPSSEGRLRLIAIPHFETTPGVVVPKDKLIFTWRVGDRLLQAESGAGRSILSATAPVRYRDTDVTVTVTTPDSALASEARVSVSPSDPVVRVYRNDPLLGIRFEEALTGAVTLRGDEETFRAVPYYFDFSPSVSWKINSVEQGTQDDITLRSSGGVGSATLDVSARSEGSFQSGSETLTVKFGANNSSNFFGF